MVYNSIRRVNNPKQKSKGEIQMRTVKSFLNKNQIQCEERPGVSKDSVVFSINGRRFYISPYQDSRCTSYKYEVDVFLLDAHYTYEDSKRFKTQKDVVGFLANYIG